MRNICILKLEKNENGFFTAAQTAAAACLRSSLKLRGINSMMYTDDTLPSLNDLAEDILSVCDDALAVYADEENKVLVIEDPTRGIDVGAIEFIWHEIQKQVEEEGVSVILITYDLNEAMTLSDRILVMYDGTFNHEFHGPNYDEKEIGLYMMGGGTSAEKA